ncbi:MAG: signal peptide peptidase SppA [Mariprofundales bacterium]
MFKKIKNGFARFGRGLEITRRILANLVFLLILGLLISAVMAQQVKINPKSALLLNIEGDLLDEADAESPFDRFMSKGPAFTTGLFDVLDAIRYAKNDTRIRMIILDMQYMGNAPLVRLDEVRHALLDFRKSGKKVIIASDYYDQKQYYLATAADEIVLDPMGIILVSGFAMNVPFMRDLLDKIGVETHVFRTGKYKGAADSLLRNSMSEASREAEGAWLGQAWAFFKERIAQSRPINVATLQSIADTPDTMVKPYDGDFALMALKLGLVDKLMPRKAYFASLHKELASNESGIGIANIDMTTYLRNVSPSKTAMRPDSEYIAILPAAGTIAGEQASSGQMPVSHIINHLRDIREGGLVKAVVLRVDSPGGSASTSEILRREIEKTQKAGIPIVVSMGPLAASGGYWIAAGSNAIHAHPLTITGSIGVIAILPKLNQSLNKLGVHTDGLRTAETSGAFNPSVPLPPTAGAAIQLGVNHAYHQFTALVANGRKMPVERVQELAQGRIWSGTDAKRVGLVDELQYINDSVIAAAKLAHIVHYKTVVLRSKPSFEELLLGTSNQTKVQIASVRTWMQQVLHISLPSLDLLSGRPLAYTPITAP